MARTFVSGSSQVAYNSSISSPSAKPITVVMRIRINAFGVYNVFGWGDQSVSDGSPGFRLTSVGPTGTIFLYDYDDVGIPAQVETSNSFTQGQWHYLAGLWVSDSSRKIYLDGTIAVDSNPLVFSQTLSNIDVIGYGAAPGNSSFISYSSISIAEAAVYNVELTTDELDQFYAGFSPEMIRPGAIIDYWPFISGNSPEPGIFGNNDLTLSGGPTVIDHPPVISTPRNKVSYVAAAAPPEEQLSLAPILVMGL